MQHKITPEIELHLDRELGFWSRLLPWRREIATHLEEAYEVARADSPETANEDTCLKQALNKFGNVQEVATDLRKEHWPQHLGWRILAVTVSALIVFSITRPYVFVDLPALGFTLLPMLSFLIFDFFHGSTRWEYALRIGIWGALAGALLGIVFTLTDMTNPSNVGNGTAISILSALYGVIFFTPRRSTLYALITIAIIDICLVVFCLYDFAANESATVFSPFLISWEKWKIPNPSYVICILAICFAGLLAGIARFGFQGIAKHAYSIGAGALLISLIVELASMSDPSTWMSHSLVAIGAMILTTAGSYCICNSAQFVRRILS